MKTRDSLTYLLIIIYSIIAVSADSIHGCGGFVEASSSLIKSRKAMDARLDYSHVTVELRTAYGLVKESTQCAPNGYYFIPVNDKGSFVIKVNGPEGWSFYPDKVAVTVDDTGCNGNEDINFRFTGFTISGRVVGAVGGESCLAKEGGPSNGNVELLSHSDDLLSSVVTTLDGSYMFKNISPGKYKLHASHPDLSIEVRGSTEGNPILGVHIYLFSDDVSEVDCPQGSGNAPRQRKALCHAVSDADGKFTFKSIPCVVCFIGMKIEGSIPSCNRNSNTWIC